MTQRVVLDEIVNPFGARVLVERGRDRGIVAARFDLAGMPRVEHLLIGRPVEEIPGLVERLCGVCPAAHHLAGVRALEALDGPVKLPAAAELARRMLHHASALATNAGRSITTDREHGVAMRRLASATSAAVGSPGHFPVTAVPGGIAAPVRATALQPIREQLPMVLDAAIRIAEREMAAVPPAARGALAFDGADVALADCEGRPDVFGACLRAVSADGTVLVGSAPPEAWESLVAEQNPGDPAPRPRLLVDGAGDGSYRVGPVAQLRVGRLTTPRAAELQQRWGQTGATAAAARAVMAVHSIEAIGALVDRPELLGTELAEPRGTVAAGTEVADSVGVGWVDGPRGLLVHRYQVGEDGRLTAAQILTPTAQNEPWLAVLLTAAARGMDGRGEPEVLAMENAIRDVDPCLPCSMAPAGAMGLVIDEVPARQSPGSGDVLAKEG